MTRNHPAIPLLTLCAVLACAHSQVPADAPTPVEPSGANVTVRVVAEATGSRLLMKNASGRPVVVDQLVLSRCENVLRRCGEMVPNDTVRPGSVREILWVAKAIRDKPVRFQYRYHWSLPASERVAAGLAAPPGVVRGRESDSLRARASGVLVLSQPLAKLLVVRIPDGSRDTVERERWQAASLSGPDETGAIALATDTTGWTEHALRLRHADGREEVLFRRRGGLLWHNTMGPVALAPRGGRIAFVSKTDAEPNNYQPLLEGALQVWDPGTRQVVDLGVTANGTVPPSWLPDGRRLVYVSGNSVIMHDVVTRERRTLVEGSHPVVSTDGRAMLMLQGGLPMLMDLGARTWKSIRIPGIIERPVAFIDGRYVVYRGFPTEGAPTGATEVFSPLVGPRALTTIKLADLETGQFVTLLDLVDPRMPFTASIRVAR